MPPAGQLALFLVAASLLAGVFSAGPSMAALLDVAASLATHLPPGVVHVALAMSVCAGSSLSLTAPHPGRSRRRSPSAPGCASRTAAPCASTSSTNVPVGLLGYGVTLAVGLAFALSGVD